MRRGRTVDASRPSRAPRPNRAARPSESCKMNIRAEPVATPNRGHVSTKPCTTTNRAARPSEPCKTNIRAEPHEPPRCAPVQAVVTDRQAAHTPEHSAVHTLDTHARPSRCHGPPGRAYARALRRAHARHAHSAVHTPEHSAVHTLDTHSLAQVTLNILCSTLSNMNNMFCFCLYTSRLPAGLTMWDNSQFMFFFIFSSTFILT